MPFLNSSAPTLGLHGETLYDVLESNSGTGNVAADAIAFNMSCSYFSDPVVNSTAGSIDILGTSYSPGYTGEFFVSSPSPSLIVTSRSRNHFHSKRKDTRQVHRCLKAHSLRCPSPRQHNRSALRRKLIVLQRYSNCRFSRRQCSMGEHHWHDGWFPGHPNLPMLPPTCQTESNRRLPVPRADIRWPRNE